MLAVNLSAFPTMIVIDQKHAFKRSAKTLVQEFAVLMLYVKLSIIIRHVPVLMGTLVILYQCVKLYLQSRVRNTISFNTSSKI